MTFTILIFAYRKPGLTPAQFRIHGEQIHIPLIKSLTGPLFPLSHVRRYIHRTKIAEEAGGPEGTVGTKGTTGIEKSEHSEGSNSPNGSRGPGGPGGPKPTSTAGGPSNPRHPATLFVGAQADVDYDGFSELTFEDETAFNKFMGKTNEPEAKRKMDEDIEGFLDKERTVMVVVGEVVETRRD